MKNKLLLLIMSLGLLIGFTPLGCKSTPNRIAYNTTSIVATTANAAVQGWWDYKKQFPDYSREDDAKVKDAYQKYQALMKVSSDAYEAYLANPAEASAWQLSLSVTAAAESNLINLITTFLPKGK